MASNRRAMGEWHHRGMLAIDRRAGTIIHSMRGILISGFSFREAGSWGRNFGIDSKIISDGGCCFFSLMKCDFLSGGAGLRGRIFAEWMASGLASIR